MRLLGIQVPVSGQNLARPLHQILDALSDGMLIDHQQFKILGAVVSTIAVLMVNMFMTPQWAPKQLTHDETMLLDEPEGVRHRVIWSIDSKIPTPVNVPTASPTRSLVGSPERGIVPVDETNRKTLVLVESRSTLFGDWRGLTAAAFTDASQQRQNIRWWHNAPALNATKTNTNAVAQDESRHAITMVPLRRDLGSASALTKNGRNGIHASIVRPNRTEG